MKNFLTALALGLSWMCIAQETTNETTTETTALASERQHEFRLDAFEGLVVPAIDLSYEYVINKFSGAGLSVFVNASGGDTDDYQTFTIAPYYRQYFFNKKDYGARGLFAEGLLQYGTGDDYYFDLLTGQDVRGDTWSAFGIGFGVGQKWVSQNGFVLEISLGGGRYFGSEDGAPGGFFRGGILIGYRPF